MERHEATWWAERLEELAQGGDSAEIARRFKAGCWSRPPDDEEHGCAWREYAEHLGTKVDALQAELEVLKRAFERRNEKMGKMPKVPRPPRTPEEIAERRTEQALLRAEAFVSDVVAALVR